MKKLDDKARKLAEDNIHLCHAFARDYAKRHQSAMRYFRWSMDDLKSMVYLALCKAARDFDPSKGYKFSTLAYISFRHEIWKASRHNCSHRARLAFDAISIYAPLPGRQEGSMIDLMRLDDTVMLEDCADQELLDMVYEAMDNLLSDAEREVLSEYAMGATQTDIARRRGCSQAHISRVIIRSHKKLREYFSTKDIAV